MPALFVGVVALLGAGCGADDADDQTAVQENIDEARSGDGGEEDIFRNPLDYVGNEVTIDGIVVDVLNDHTVRIESTEVVGEELFVLHPQREQIDQGDRLTVRGKMMDLEVPEIEREFDTEIDEHTVGEYDDDVAVVALEIETD